MGALGAEPYRCFLLTHDIKKEALPSDIRDLNQLSLDGPNPSKVSAWLTTNFNNVNRSETLGADLDSSTNNLFDDKVSQSRRALQDLNTNRVVEKDPKKKVIADAKYKATVDSLKSARISFEKPMNDASDSSIAWLEIELAILKVKSDKIREEKNCLNKSVDYLANIYSFKRDKARGKDLKAFDLYDEKFKLYDNLHDSFK